MAKQPAVDADVIDPLSTSVIHLLKGVVYRRDDEAMWNALVAIEARVRDYVKVLNLQLEIDDSEGYAFLRLRQDSDPDQERKLPQLIVRHPLSFQVSLLLALLRKKLVEFDAEGGDIRLILTRDQIIEIVRVFLPDTSNEVKLRRQINGYLSRIVRLGFLRRMNVSSSGSQPTFEVQRIIKKYVNAQWLADFESKLARETKDNTLRGEHNHD
jgi:hypothetical protein